MQELSETEKVKHIPATCYECGKILTGEPVVWNGLNLCARCGDFYSRWPEKKTCATCLYTVSRNGCKSCDSEYSGWEPEAENHK